MLVALIVVVVVVAGAVVAKLTWRPSNDEVHSVKDYRSALGTIGDLARRNPPPGSPPAARPQDPGRAGVDPGTPLVFDDDRLSGRTQQAPGGEVAPVFRSDRARRQALSSMNHRPRRWVLTVAIVVVLLAFGALAYVGSHRNTDHSATKQTSPPSTHVSSADHTRASTPPTGPTKPQAKTRPTTPTTVAAQITAISTTDTTGTYPVPSTPYQVEVTATTEPCWILAQSAASGDTLWTGTIQTGNSQIIQGSGAMGLELGAPGVAVTVNGTPVVLPSPLNVPFQVTFTPGSAPTTTTTPAAPTSTTAPATTGTSP